jgi:Spy/CpxP family protein refolding chaperone
MSRQLRLTPDQRRQMDGILEDTKRQITRERRNYELKRHKLMLEAYLRIVTILGSEQRARFDRKFVPPALRLEAQRQSPTPTPLSRTSPLAMPSPVARVLTPTSPFER